MSRRRVSPQFLAAPLLCLLLAAALGRVALGQEYPTYEPDWTSLDLRYTPIWFDEAKVGILVYWGAHSVLSYADSTMRSGSPALLRPDFYARALSDGPSQDLMRLHRRRFGPNATYRDAVRSFRPSLFDPAAWARIFSRSGARYVVTTARLEDGFALWPSPTRWNWNATTLGPGRDLVGEVLTAVRGEGLYTGVYYTLADGGHPDYATLSDRWRDEVMLPELQTLADSYLPDIIWTDADSLRTASEWGSEPYLAWLFGASRVGPQVAVNDRWGRDARGVHGGFTTYPCNSTAYRSHRTRSRRDKWEACVTLGRSMGFNRADQLDDYLSSAQLIDRLVDVVSRGGNLLIVVGPTPDGRIPDIVEERLTDLGRWMAINGEAIYNSRPWRVQQEGRDVRYVARGNVVYAVLSRWPGSELVLDEPNPSHYSHFTLLGRPGELRWTRDDDKVRIFLPDLSPDELPSRFATVLRMTVIN